MRIILIFLLVVIFIAILLLSDFFLTSIIRKRINEINQESEDLCKFKPISFLKTTAIGAFFWVSPMALLPDAVKLEYKIIMTLFFWTGLTSLIFYYISYRSSSSVAKKSMPFIIVPALLSGIIFVPIYVLLKDFLQ